MHSEHNIRVLYQGLSSILKGRAFAVSDFVMDGFTCTVRSVPVKIEWSDPATISVSVNGEEPLRRQFETDAGGNITHDGMSSLATDIARGVLNVDRRAAEPAAGRLSVNETRQEFDDETIRILRDIMAVLQKATR